MSKGQRVALYTGLAAYSSALKAGADSASMASLVYTSDVFEVLTKAAELTTGRARQQVLSVLSLMMQNTPLFAAPPSLERLQGLREVLAKAQNLYDASGANDSGPISSLLTLFACSKHPGVDLNTWEPTGRIRILPTFTMSSTVACLKPPTVKELADLYAKVDVAAAAEIAHTEKKDTTELTWPEPSEQVVMIMEMCGFERNHVEFCLMKSEGNPDAAVDMLLAGNFHSEMPPEQELIAKVTGVEMPSDKPDDNEADKPKKTKKINTEEAGTPPKLDNLLIQKQELCAVSPYFEVALFQQASGARVAMGLRKANGEIVLSFDSYGSLFLLESNGALMLQEDLKLQEALSEKTAVGCGICYDQYGKPTSELTIFASARLDSGVYKHLCSVKAPFLLEGDTALYPFVSIADAGEIEDPEMNVVAVSRIPNAGKVTPLLDLHPQLLQAPIAQLRSVESVATAVETGSALPRAFRMIEPHPGSESPDDEGFVSDKGDRISGHRLLDNFRGGAFVVSLACSTECIARIILKSVNQKKPDYVVQIGPQRRLAVGTRTFEAVEGRQGFFQAEKLMKEKVTLLKEGALPAGAVPTFQTVTLAFVAGLIEAALIHGLANIADPEALKGLKDHDTALEPITQPVGDAWAEWCEGKTTEEIQTMRQSHLLDALLASLAIENQLGFQLVDFGIYDASYFNSDGNLPFSGLTVAKLADHFYSLFNSGAADKVLQQALWVRLAGSTLEVGTGETFYGGPRSPTIVCADIGEDSRCLNFEIADGVPQVQGVEFASTCSEEKAKPAPKPELVEAKRLLLSLFGEVDKEGTGFAKKDHLLAKLWEVNSDKFSVDPTGEIQTGSCPEGQVYEYINNLSETMVEAEDYADCLDRWVGGGDLSRPLAPCKWQIRSHTSTSYRGDESPFVFLYRDGQSHNPQLPVTMAEDTADLPDGWNKKLDEALAQFCSKKDGLGTMDELRALCQSGHGQAMFAPLLRLCGAKFPAVIRIRAASMGQISKMALGVLHVLPFGDPNHVLVRAFGSLAPLVFAKDKAPAIKAAMDQFSKPNADKPDLALDRFASLEPDPTGDSTIFGQVAKQMANRGSKMYGISTYHGTNPQFFSCNFTGEDGQDAGGLFRDCMSNIGEELMSDKTPLFIQSGNELQGKCWVPNPSCQDVQKYFFLGQLMGACIRMGEPLSVDIAPFFWLKLAGRPVSWEDFSHCAPQVADSINQIENMEISEEDFEYLYLDFTFVVLGGNVIELVPDGANRDVTFADRAEFCRLAKEVCMAQFDKQIELIRSGLDDYHIPAVALMLWTPYEFQEKVAGQLEIPVDGLRKNIELHGSGTAKSHFWEAVERMSMEQRSLLLKFGTGRSRLPCHMTLHLENGSSPFGTASTCSFEMYLPNYADAEAMYQGILATIACGSFGNA